MRKIPTVYVRDLTEPRHVTEEVNPGCEWVLTGEGTATRKLDGTCVMLDESGAWWARRTLRAWEITATEPPRGFVALDTDLATGRTVGWEPIEQSPFHRWHKEALGWLTGADANLLPGTYELVGPRINGNRERSLGHRLARHGCQVIKHKDDAGPREIVELCRERGWEGVVWHHDDGRMAKLKVRDLPT